MSCAGAQGRMLNSEKVLSNTLSKHMMSRNYTRPVRFKCTKSAQPTFCVDLLVAVGHCAHDGQAHGRTAASNVAGARSPAGRGRASEDPQCKALTTPHASSDALCPSQSLNVARQRS